MGVTRGEDEAFDLERRETDVRSQAPQEPGRHPHGGGAFRALKSRNYRLFWSGQAISLIGTWAQNLAQGWLIILLVDPVAHAMLRHGGVAVGAATQHQSPAVEAAANMYSGWVNFAGGLPIFLFSLLGGVVADRVDRRKMLLVTQSALILCAVGLGVLAVTGQVEIWHVLLFAGLSGVAASFDMPTRQAFVAEMVGKEDLPSAIALNSSVFNAARALGPALAGLLLAARVSIGMTFLGNAALSLAVIIGLLMIRIPPKVEAAAKAAVDNSLRTVWVNMREGFEYCRSHHTVRNLIILVATFGTFAFSFNVLIPVFVRYTLLPHATDAAQVKAFGFMETIRGLGALAGALTVAFLGTARTQRNMLIAGSLLSTVLLVVFAEARVMWVAYATMCIVSYGFVLCFATSNTLMQLNVPDALRGRVMSIYTLMFIGTMPFGSLFAGSVAKYIGAPPTILLCAVISLVATVVLVFRRGGLRDISTAPHKVARSGAA